jgi:hypothetical protein
MAPAIGDCNQILIRGGSSPAARYASSMPASASARSAGCVESPCASHSSRICGRRAICAAVSMLSFSIAQSATVRMASGLYSSCRLTR